MAKSGNFTFTNTTATTNKTLSLFDMAELTNYGPEKVTNGTSYLNTIASDADAPEKFILFKNVLRTVNTALNVAFPSRKRVAAANAKKGSAVYEGIEYGVTLDAIHTEVDSADATYRVDRPVRVEIRIRHEDAATITNSQIITLLGRAVSVLENAAGTSRLPNIRGGITTIQTN